MITWWMLAACAPSGPWTADAALAPTLARLDRDHDSHVTATEFEAVAFPPVPFSLVDSDGDGELAMEELADCLFAQEPADFFEMRGLPPEVGRPSSDLNRLRETPPWRLFESLRQELVATNAGAVVPGAAEIELAAAAGLSSLEAQALLRTFEAAYTREGLTFPPVFRPPP